MGLMAMPFEAPEESIRARAVYEVMPAYHSPPKVAVDVVVRISINESGEVDQTWCPDQTQVLGELAARAARLWKFEPILVDGRPTSVESHLTFRFKSD
jgi:outer membrane biosynthesis protein TonB